MQLLHVLIFAIAQFATAKQYQHWVPQFIVRNFAKDSNKKLKISNQLVNFYDKQQQTVFLVPTKDIFGAYDLYEDPHSIFETEAMEKMFSKLENAASPIIKEAVDKGVLPKDPKSLFTLQKFLYTLTLRKESWRNFFNQGVFNAHTENSVIKYMKKYGLQSTHQIWIRELNSLMSLENKAQIPSLKDNLFGDFHKDLVEFMDMNVQIWKVNPKIDGELFLSDNNMGKWVGSPGNYEKAVIRYFFPLHPKIAIVVEADKKAYQKRCQAIGLPKTSYLHFMGVSDVPMLPQTNKLMNQNAVNDFNDVLFDDANMRHGIVFRTLNVFQQSKLAKGKNIVVSVDRAIKVERKAVVPFAFRDYTTYEYTGVGPQQTYYCMFCGDTLNCCTDFREEETLLHGSMHEKYFGSLETLEEKLQIVNTIKRNLSRYYHKLLMNKDRDEQDEQKIAEIGKMFLKALQLFDSINDSDLTEMNIENDI